MFLKFVAKTVLYVFLCFEVLHVFCMVEITPERAGVTFFNPNYTSSAKLFITRVGPYRKYCLNLEASTFVPWGNNVTIHYTYYTRLNREWKKTPLDMRFKLCEFINKDPLVSKTLAKVGVVCPISVGTLKYSIMGLTPVEVPNMPMASTQGRIEWEYSLTENPRVVLTKGFLYVKIKNCDFCRTKTHLHSNIIT